MPSLAGSPEGPEASRGEGTSSHDLDDSDGYILWDEFSIRGPTCSDALSEQTAACSSWLPAGAEQDPVTDRIQGR